MTANVENSLPHCTAGSVECINKIRTPLGDEGFVFYCWGNVLKYALRSYHECSPAQDLQKALWYLGKAAQELEMSHD